MMPVHFYHLYVGVKDWRRVALEHFQALSYYGFTGDVRVGLVGPEDQRRRARLFLKQMWPDAEVSVEAHEGFEQVTLSALHAAVQSLEPRTPVLYAHAKGSVNTSTEQERWRICMSSHVIKNWRGCIRLLSEVDAVGPHWITGHLVHAYFGKRLDTYPKHFGGNFWWANAGYLAPLESPMTYEYSGDRWDAEWWVGSGDPKIVDLEPGWPFHPHRVPTGKPVTDSLWNPRTHLGTLGP
jgi:hypothetical protein